MIKKIVREIFACKHKNAVLHSNEGYCPDCGQYLKKNYYIIRCSCCGIKRAGKKRFDEISPSEKFCTNCGCSEYVVEKHEKLNIIDINYAIEVKEKVEYGIKSENIEIWIDDICTKETKPQSNIPLIGQVKYSGAG